MIYILYVQFHLVKEEAEMSVLVLIEYACYFSRGYRLSCLRIR